MPTSLHYLTVNRKFIERPRILSLPLFLLFSHSVVSGSSATPWTVTHQAPLSMGFPRQEYWNGLPLPSPGYHPEPGIKPRSPALRADSLLSAAAAAAKSLQSCPTLATPWTVTHQAPLSMGFFRQEYWSGCHFLLQEIIPIQGSNPRLLCLLHL